MLADLEVSGISDPINLRGNLGISISLCCQEMLMLVVWGIRSEQHFFEENRAVGKQCNSFEKQKQNAEVVVNTCKFTFFFFLLSLVWFQVFSGTRSHYIM